MMNLSLNARQLRFCFNSLGGEIDVFNEHSVLVTSFEDQSKVKTTSDFYIDLECEVDEFKNKCNTSTIHK